MLSATMLSDNIELYADIYTDKGSILEKRKIIIATSFLKNVLPKYQSIAQDLATW